MPLKGRSLSQHAMFQTDESHQPSQWAHAIRTEAKERPEVTRDGGGKVEYLDLPLTLTCQFRLHRVAARNLRWNGSSTWGTKSWREQEEGGELDSHNEVSPEEIKNREVELGWRVGLFASVVAQQQSYGHCLCDSVLHSSCDSNCVVLWSLCSAGWTLP